MLRFCLCEKFKKLRTEERVICIFSLLISIILILNIVVDMAHLINYNINKSIVTNEITDIEDRLDEVERKLEENDT